MTVLEYIISALTPLECYICNIEGSMLCPSCVQGVLAEQTSRCYMCNRLTDNHRLCSGCRSRSSIRRLQWLAHYDGTIKELIYGIKLGKKRAYAREFGRLMADVLPYLAPDTVIVSAPTATSRIRQRGYDQAKELAQSLARTRGVAYIDTLVRLNQTDQIGKKRVERLKQMRNALALRSPHKIKNRTVLLVDDVLTTGATLEAAARLLRDNGAKHVDAIVIARHLPK